MSPKSKVPMYFLSTITTAIFRRERKANSLSAQSKYSKDYTLSTALCLSFIK